MSSQDQCKAGIGLVRGPASYGRDDYGDDYGDDEGGIIDGVGFAQAGSALRAATRDNPRDRPCPECGAANVLTRLDVARSYRCDRCADACERGEDCY